VTIILGGDSLIHKTKTPTPYPWSEKGRCDAALRREGATQSLKSFSIRVVASWIKLLVIMHTDKISVRKKEREIIFLDKASSFDLSILFLEIHIRSPHHRPSNDILNIKD
jgi:hypothetical protein